MMAVVMKLPLHALSLLLILFSTVLFCCVEAQVRFSLRGTHYGNDSLVRMDDIGENDDALICSTNFSPCCGTVPNRHGEWYHPNGSSSRPIGSGDTIYRSRHDDGTVRLHRRSGALLNTNGKYRCRIPNGQGTEVDLVVTILNANVIPSVVQNPEHSFNSDPGTTISLSIVATSTVFYLWQVNNTDIFNNDKYEGARTSTLVIHNIQENDEGFYSCIFGNQYLTIASDVAVVTVLNLPTIVEHPDDQLDTEEGSTVMFSVTVQGLRLSFYWMFGNGSQLTMDDKYSGQNTSILTIYSVSHHDSAQYRCQISNAAGTVTSDSAHLTILTTVQIEAYDAIPGITSALLRWSLAERAQEEVDYFSLKYFPVLFPDLALTINTTNTSYEAVRLIPRATYRFELLPVLNGNTTAKAISIDVYLHTPIPPVDNVSVSVNSATTILVSWTMGRDLLGWSSLYYNVYYSAYSPNGLHSVQQKFESYNTSINISINHLALEADWQHQFEITTVLIVAIEGLEAIEGEKAVVAQKIQMDEALFQLVIGPIDYCIQWDVVKANSFRRSIRLKVASIISSSCDCAFPLHLIGDGVFSCRTSPNYVAYRSKVTGFSAAALVQHVLDKITIDPTLEVDWLILNIYSQCSMRLNSLGDPDCSMPFNITQESTPKDCSR